MLLLLSAVNQVNFVPPPPPPCTFLLCVTLNTCLESLKWDSRATSCKTIYSYFEKGCREKCTRQSWKELWVVLSSLFFKEIWNNWHERPWKCVCECQRKATKVGSTGTVVRNSVLIISHTTFRDCRVHIFSDNLPRNSCIPFIAIGSRLLNEITVRQNNVRYLGRGSFKW